jgi:hypothetical protein
MLNQCHTTAEHGSTNAIPQQSMAQPMPYHSRAWLNQWHTTAEHGSTNGIGPTSIRQKYREIEAKHAVQFTK